MYLYVNAHIYVHIHTCTYTTHTHTHIYTVKSPYFVTAHNFVTTGQNFWKSPFLVPVLDIKFVLKHNANEIFFSFEVLL